MKSVATFTGKDRTATLRLTDTDLPQTAPHGLFFVVEVGVCDADQPPSGLQYATYAVGQARTVDVRKGTRWVAVWCSMYTPCRNDQWRLTFNHLT